MTKAMATNESLEFRLERVKQLGNIRLNSLKSLYQGHSIVEGYAQDRLNVNLHLEVHGTAVCGRFSDHLPAEDLVMHNHDEVFMLVEVADLSECSNPIASVVRLQPLNCCNMRGSEAIQEPSFAEGISLKAFWRLFDRELVSSFDTCVENGKLDDEIVQSSSKTVRNITGQDSAGLWNRRMTGVIDTHELDHFTRAYNCARIGLDDGSFSLSLAEFGMEGFKLREVFVGPCESSVSAI